MSVTCILADCSCICATTLCMATCMSMCMGVEPVTYDGACGCAEEYKRIRELIVGNGKRPGMMKAMGKGGGGRGGGMNPHNMQMNVQQMSRMLPPDVLKKMGGAGALQGLLKQMEGSGMKM